MASVVTTKMTAEARTTVIAIPFAKIVNLIGMTVKRTTGAARIERPKKGGKSRKSDQQKRKSERR